MRVDPTGDPIRHAGHCHPFVAVGDGVATSREGGQDSEGPLRQAPSRSLRPTGSMHEVDGRARPTDHYQDSKRQPGKHGSDLARSPTRTITAPPSAVVDHRVCILAAGYRALCQRLRWWSMKSP